MARLVRPLRLLAPLLLAGVVLSSCGAGGAVTDARQSCKNVLAALTLQRESDAPGITPGEKSRLQGKAMSELLQATPMAAEATSQDGSWNPLMTTINEAERVPLQDLAPALTRLCRVADSTSPYL